MSPCRHGEGSEIEFFANYLLCDLCSETWYPEDIVKMMDRLAASEADARALAQAIRNWSAGDDETMAIVDDALLNLLETVGAKYLEGEL